MIKKYLENIKTSFEFTLSLGKIIEITNKFAENCK